MHQKYFFFKITMHLSLLLKMSLGLINLVMPKYWSFSKFIIKIIMQDNFLLKISLGLISLVMLKYWSSIKLF